MKPAADLARLRGALSARFDGAALRAPAPAGAPPAAVPPAWRQWCLDALRRSPPPEPYGLAAVPVAAGGADHARLAAAAWALALELDGSLALQACAGPAARLALRLRVKLHDAWPGRRRRAGDIWDSGQAIDTPAGQQALARWQPRRPTLIVADAPSPGLVAVLGRLARDQATFLHPVRVLVLWPGGAWPGPGRAAQLDCDASA